MNNIIYILLSFFITGVLIGILFDVFRISRKAFKLPDWIIYIEDILFWIITGVLILFTIFTFANRRNKVIYDWYNNNRSIYLLHKYK